MKAANRDTIGRGMLWVRRLLLVLAVALVVGNAQCVVLCAAGSCHQSDATSRLPGRANLPPCHRHKVPKPTAPTPCTSSVFLVYGRGPSVPRTGQLQARMLSGDPPVSLYEASVRRKAEAIPSTASPLLAAEPVSWMVLRI